MLAIDDDHEVKIEDVVVVVVQRYELWQETDDRLGSIDGNDENPTRKQILTGYSRLISPPKVTKSSPFYTTFTHLPMHVFGLKKNAQQHEGRPQQKNYNQGESNSYRIH
jgi:hypothetical protein